MNLTAGTSSSEVGDVAAEDMTVEERYGVSVQLQVRCLAVRVRRDSDDVCDFVRAWEDC